MNLILLKITNFEYGLRYKNQILNCFNIFALGTICFITQLFREGIFCKNSRISILNYVMNWNHLSKNCCNMNTIAIRLLQASNKLKIVKLSNGQFFNLTDVNFGHVTLGPPLKGPHLLARTRLALVNKGLPC